MDKALTPSSQLNSSQTPNSNTSVKSAVTNSNLSNVQVSVNSQLLASIQLPKSNDSALTLQGQLTVNQASALQSNPALLLLTQQQALLFLKSQLTTQQITLSPELVKLATAWLSQINQSHSKQRLPPTHTAMSLAGKTIPTQLATLFSQSVNLPTASLMQKMQSIQLKLNLIEFSFLQGDAIAQIKLPQKRPVISQEQLQQTLQFLIPLGVEDSSSLLVKQDLNDEHNYTNQDKDNNNQFELTFNLDNLGKLVIKVKLNEFEMNTKCLYSNLALEQKVKRFWPQLTSRLEKLGFDITNQFYLTPELEQSNTTTQRFGLIDTQV